MITELDGMRSCGPCAINRINILSRINGISPSNCNEDTVPLQHPKMTFADDGVSAVLSANYRKLGESGNFPRYNACGVIAGRCDPHQESAGYGSFRHRHRP